MKLSAQGLQLIKQQEGFRSRTYLDVAGFPTIGYGHLLIHPDSFPDGIDEAQAGEILAADVRDAEQAVGRLVKVALTQGQFDALVDFCFNLGSGRLASSTLLKVLNGGRYAEAAEQLLAGIRPAARSAQPSRHAARPNSPSGTLPASPWQPDSASSGGASTAWVPHPYAFFCGRVGRYRRRSAFSHQDFLPFSSSTASRSSGFR